MKLALFALLLNCASTFAQEKQIFESACSNGNAKYLVELADTEVSFITVAYKDTFKCDDGNQTTRYEVSHAISQSTSSGTIAEAVAIDSQVDGYFVTSLSQWQADKFNNLPGDPTGYCGFRDWEVNVRKDVSGTACGRSLINRKLYQVYKISGDSFWLGLIDAKHSAVSPDLRPVQLNLVEKYTRIN